MSISIVVAPPDEQTAIVNRMNEETAPLRAVITRTEREIALLREYRTRLIADVVTGKLDVREAARHLPAEVEETEASLEAEDLADDADMPDISEEEISA
jgi:type I restriction enzyme S subunit